MLFFYFQIRLNKLLNLQMPECFTTVKMNTLIFTFHFWLHNSTAHLDLSNVLQSSRRFATQWNLLCWKFKIDTIFWGTNTKIHEFTNPRTCNFYPNHENWCPRRKKSTFCTFTVICLSIVEPVQSDIMWHRQKSMVPK